MTAEADGTTLTLSDRPNRAKLELRSTKDRSALAIFTASSVDALLTAYPALKTWPGVAALLEKHAVAKAERAKAEEAARKQAEVTPRGAARHEPVGGDREHRRAREGDDRGDGRRRQAGHEDL